jgi:MoaA/NifB/PqqE/SkfB family radical SAM enzyme
MIIETNQSIYDIAMNVAQIEITGRCNMGCLHCRGKISRNFVNGQQDMPVWAVKKVIDFAYEHSEDGFVEIVLSGGEPILHPELEEIIKYCDQLGVFKEITTNGSLVDEKYVNMLKKYNITNMSVSIDSSLPEVHDDFRQCPGAFDKAIKSIKLMLENGINTRIRATISKKNMNDFCNIADLAVSLGVSTLAVGPMLPVGNAVGLKGTLFDNQDEMRQFIDTFHSVREQYKGKLDIITNECLHDLDGGEESEGTLEQTVLNGCTAGVVTFNVLLNGDITPCSMFHVPIANIYTDEDLLARYRNSEVVKNLLDRNYKGKCGVCGKKYECGGCRVRAEYYYHDYLQQDPLCWL